MKNKFLDITATVIIQISTVLHRLVVKLSTFALKIKIKIHGEPIEISRYTSWKHVQRKRLQDEWARRNPDKE